MNDIIVSVILGLSAGDQGHRVNNKSNNMHEQKIEGILVIRDMDGKMIAVISRPEGQQQYEIYMTSTASIEDIQYLLANKPEPKI